MDFIGKRDRVREMRKRSCSLNFSMIEECAAIVRFSA